MANNQTDKPAPFLLHLFMWQWFTLNHLQICNPGDDSDILSRRQDDATDYTLCYCYKYREALRLKNILVAENINLGILSVLYTFNTTQDTEFHY